MTGEREEAMQITDQEAQYDASAKRLLAQKYVLAHLLVKTVKEFREMDTIVQFRWMEDLRIEK